MKLTRKPLTKFVALLVFGLPLDVVWGNSDAEYSPDSVYKPRDGSGSAVDVSHTKIAADVANVIKDVTRINRHSAQLKQRVLSMELQLSKALRQYQTKTSESEAVENINSARTSSVGKTPHLTPARLTFKSIQEPFESVIAPPELAIAEEPATIESEIVAMQKQIDEGIAAAAPTDEPPVVDSGAVSDEIVEPSIIGEELAMNDTRLSEMRGGFTTTSGLQVTFGIQRVLYVNGELISTTSLNVLNLGNATVTTIAPITVTPVAAVTVDLAANVPGVDTSSTPAMTLPRTNADAPATTTSMPGNAAPSSTAPATVANTATAPVASTATAPAASTASTASTSSASSSAPTSIQPSSVTSIPDSLALIQVGAENAVSSGTFSTSSASTIIQNTLNNQKIQNITVINATVNSMQILKTLNLQAAISSAINDSVRK